MRFHLAHIVPNARQHGLRGYKDVIDSVQWGLQQLGHTATYGVNRIEPGVRNIIFGAHMILPGPQAGLPEDSIVYNFEQVRNVPADAIASRLGPAAGRLRVWDYSGFNLEAWKTVATKYPVTAVPVGYAPVLERVPNASTPDIDVLFYGMPNNDRLSAFHAVGNSGLTTAFLTGLYGSARDALIGRSKLVANVSLYTHSNIFEIVRVSYLLANRRAVVASMDKRAAVEDDIAAVLTMTDAKAFVRTIKALATNDAERAEVARRGYEAFRKRDIRTILEAALDTE
jgi:hypothetical protein